MKLSQHDAERLKKFLRTIKKRSENFLGYPVSNDFDYSDLLGFLSYPLNNIGDPFCDGTWKVDSRQYEQEVVEFIAKLFRADPDDYWGYVTNGGSEGNLYGLYLAREMYPDGVVYFSQDTHYSVVKNIHLLNMKSEMISSQANGEIDYIDLKKRIIANKHLPVIIFANIGTTMTEAKDDLKKIKNILNDLLISQHYIHSDAALCGGLSPFITPRIPFDFKDGANSISVSGHKSFGSPIPCGIVIAQKSNVMKFATTVDYIGNVDTTISGSRNGITPLILWYAIKSLGIDGLKMRVAKALEMAEYSEERLKSVGVKAWRNSNAITVVFPEVSSRLKEKYQLATSGGQTHLVVMPHIKKEVIDSFIEEMMEENLLTTAVR